MCIRLLTTLVLCGYFSCSKAQNNDKYHDGKLNAHNGGLPNATENLVREPTADEINSLWCAQFWSQIFKPDGSIVVVVPPVSYDGADDIW